MSLADLRKAYAKAELDERSVERHPLRQFLAWLDEAVHADLVEPNAMTLATSTPDGHPSARMVLLKGADEHGLVFFTDSRSRKGAELAANPQAVHEVAEPRAVLQHLRPRTAQEIVRERSRHPRFEPVTEFHGSERTQRCPGRCSTAPDHWSASNAAMT